MIERSRFSIDSIAGEVFFGFSNGSEWNGWACPYFEREEAERVLRLSETNGFQWNYLGDADAYVVSHANDEDDAPEVFEGQTIVVDNQKIKVYPIGAYAWIWEFAEE